MITRTNIFDMMETRGELSYEETETVSCETLATPDEIYTAYIDYAKTLLARNIPIVANFNLTPEEESNIPWPAIGLLGTAGQELFLASTLMQYAKRLKDGEDSSMSKEEVINMRKNPKYSHLPAIDYEFYFLNMEQLMKIRRGYTPEGRSHKDKAGVLFTEDQAMIETTFADVFKFLPEHLRQPIPPKPQLG